jgi:hypothetical protein
MDRWFDVRRRLVELSSTPPAILGRQSVVDMNMFHENRGAKEVEE